MNDTDIETNTSHVVSSIIDSSTDHAVVADGSTSLIPKERHMRQLSSSNGNGEVDHVPDWILTISPKQKSSDSNDGRKVKEEEEKKEEIATPKAKLHELLLKSSSSQSPTKVAVASLPSPRSKSNLSSAPSLLSKLPAPSKQVDLSLVGKNTSALSMSPSEKLHKSLPPGARSPRILSRFRPDFVNESSNDDRNEVTIENIKEDVKDEIKRLPPPPPSLENDTSSTQLVKQVNSLPTVAMEEVYSSSMVPSELLTTISTVLTSSASFQCFVPATSHVIHMRNDTEKKSVAWLDESCFPEKKIVNIVEPWVLEVQSDNGAKDIIIECPKQQNPIETEGSLPYFHIGGLQVISNARNIDVHIMEKGGNSFTNLMSCRGIPVKAVTSVVSSSPAKTVGGYYKAMCVVPGGARSVSAVKLSFKSVSSASRSLGMENQLSAHDDIARISSIRLTARIPVSVIPETLLSVPASPMLIKSVLPNEVPTEAVSMTNTPASKEVGIQVPVLAVPPILSTRDRQLPSTSGKIAISEESQGNIVADQGAILMGGLTSVIKETEDRLQRGIGETKEALEGKLVSTINDQQSTINSLNEKVNEMQKQLAKISELLQQKSERENERDREIQSMISREQNREFMLSMHSDKIENSAKLSENGTERKIAAEMSKDTNTDVENIRVESSVQLTASSVNKSVKSTHASVDSLPSRSRHSPQKLNMLLRMKEEVESVLLEAGEVVSSSQHQRNVSLSPKKSSVLVPSPVLQLEPPMEIECEKESKSETLNNDMSLDKSLPSEKAECVDVQPSIPTRTESVESKIVEVFSDEVTSDECKIVSAEDKIVEVLSDRVTSDECNIVSAEDEIVEVLSDRVTSNEYKIVSAEDEIVEVLSDKVTADECKIITAGDFTATPSIPMNSSSNGGDAVEVVMEVSAAAVKVVETEKVSGSESFVTATISNHENNQSFSGSDFISKNEEANDICIGSSLDIGASNEMLILVGERKVEKDEADQITASENSVQKSDNPMEVQKTSSNARTVDKTYSYDDVLTNTSSVYDDDGNLKVLPNPSIIDSVQCIKEEAAYEGLEVAVKTFFALN